MKTLSPSGHQAAVSSVSQTGPAEKPRWLSLVVFCTLLLREWPVRDTSVPAEKRGLPGVVEFVEVPIGSGGDLRCVKCHPQRSDAVPIAEAEVASALRSNVSRRSGGPGPNVVFAGFEPFAHPDLPSLIGAAVSLGYERIRLRTDAGALGSHGNAEGAFSAGVRQIEVVLLGNGTIHDTLAGKQGLYEAASAGVRRFAAIGGAASFVSARVVVCRHNVRSLPEAVAAASELECGAVVLDVNGLKPLSEHRALVEAALETATLNRIAASASGWSGESPFSELYRRAQWRMVGETR